jgi:hypothetical protein
VTEQDGNVVKRRTRVHQILGKAVAKGMRGDILLLRLIGVLLDDSMNSPLRQWSTLTKKKILFILIWALA